MLEDRLLMDGNFYYTIEGDKVTAYDGLRAALETDGVYDDFVEKRTIKMVGIYSFSDGTTWYSFPKYFDHFQN